MNLRDWYGNLSARERNLVAVAAALLAVAALYFAAVLPVQTMTHKRVVRVEQKASDLVWLREVAPQVRAAAASPGGAAAATGESLVVLVDRTAREAGLGSSLGGQSPEGEHGLRVRLQAAPFDAVVGWLAALQQQHGVAIDAASVDATATPGLVNANLTLRAPGGPGA